MRTTRREVLAGLLAGTVAALTPGAVRALPRVPVKAKVPSKAILTNYTYEGQPVYALFLSDVYTDPMFRDGVYRPEGGYPGSCRGSYYGLTYIDQEGRTIPVERLNPPKIPLKRL
jgi:hypothetical protein